MYANKIHSNLYEGNLKKVFQTCAYLHCRVQPRMSGTIQKVQSLIGLFVQDMIPILWILEKKKTYKF